MMHFPQAVILPPKIYHYEPKISGFKIAGKRGSKYFNPPKGNVRLVDDSVQGLELEELRKEAASTSAASNAADPSTLPIDFSKQLDLSKSNQNDASAAKAAAASSSATGGEEDNEAQLFDGAARTNAHAGGKKNRKKKNAK